MSDEDFYKPTNIRDSIFGDIDLPEQSRIQKVPQKVNKYRQDSHDQEDDQFDLGFSNLGEVSKIQPNNKYQPPMQIIKQTSDIKKETSDSFTRPNSAEKQNSQKQSVESHTVSMKKGAQQVRKTPQTRTNIKGGKSNSQKVVVDIDAQIGEVRQWGHRDQEDKQSDFDKEQQQIQAPKVDRQAHEQMRRRAEQKVRQMQNKNYKSQHKPMGLAAKAEQLRRKNQQQKLLNSHNQKKQTNKPVYVQSQTSSNNLMLNKQTLKDSSQKDKTGDGSQKPIQISKPANKSALQDQDVEDYWDKINQKNKQQYQQTAKKKQNAQAMTKQHIIDFYFHKFIYVEEDIQVQFQIDSLEQEQVPGCWEAIFGCFKSDKKDPQGQVNKTKHKSSKNRTAMRLLAISKINVTNTDQEFFVLKEIWDKLACKKFARYGNHWNEIGFQGRDPATDLRSTGFLSLLQWYIFIDQNTKEAKQIFNWTLQYDFPLALTHIKATGLFLKLLKTGKIKGNSWNEFQKCYNAIVWNAFKKIKQNYNQTENVGEIVDKNLESVRKNISQSIKLYDKHKGT